MTADIFLRGEWASGQGGEAVGSCADVRRLRQADIARSIAKWDRVAAQMQADDRSEDEIEKALLALLQSDPG